MSVEPSSYVHGVSATPLLGLAVGAALEQATAEELKPNSAKSGKAMSS
jgi:hypothetical protein